MKKRWARVYKKSTGKKKIKTDNKRKVKKKATKKL